MQAHAAPVSPGERIATLDAIRGFALLGIFIMNMPAFYGSIFAGAGGILPWPQWWNRSAEIVRDVIFSGKFNSMFSMLFALGFTIQLERLRAREPQRAVAIYLRRTFWLLVFGMLHACLFWVGDILHMYALFGFLLLVLYRFSDRAILVLIALCVAYPAVSGVVRVAMSTPQTLEQLTALVQSAYAADNAILGQGSSFWQAAQHNAHTMVVLYTNELLRWNLLGGYMQILTTMLLGLLLGRHRFFQNSAQHLPLVRRTQWWALAVGILCGVVYGAWEATVQNRLEPTVWKVIASMSYVLCRVGIMVFYVCLIVRGMHNGRWRRWLSPVVLMGRMPLTNYLLQTLIGTSLFYGWGLGFWGEVGPALGLVIPVVIFFAIQYPLTRWWLNRFQLGPMEYLWRVLTYGKPALRSIVMAPPAQAA